MAQDNNKFKVLRPLVKDDRIEDMRSSLWSRLPWELVDLIITHTTCQATQDAWCLATNNMSRHLNDTAMKTRWYSITIDDRDLLPAPGDDQIKFDINEARLHLIGVAQSWKPVGQTLEVLSTTNKWGRYPADYVRQIVFDFRMLQYMAEKIQDQREFEPDDWDEEFAEFEPYDMMPSLEAAEYTLNQLQRFRNLTHIICYGDTPQQLWSWIGKSATGARVLLLRGHGSYGALWRVWDDRPRFELWPPRRPPLEMRSLSIFQQLLHLDVHRLSSNEVQAMRVSLPKLINLQTLVIACNDAEHGERYICAFDLLFSAIPERESSESMIWLPPGLKHLSMIDTYDEFRKMDTPVSQQQYLDFPDSLEHLNLDLAKLSLATRVLDRIQSASLRFLAVPEYCTRTLGYYGQEQLCDFVQQGVESLRLMRAWDFENNHLESLRPLRELYTVDDLVLGTRNADYYWGFIYQWREKIPTPTLADYLYGFSWSGPEKMTGRWGGTLKRVRFDHIDIAQDLDISMLSQSLWQELKILMLQPAPRSQRRDIEGYDANLVNEAVCDELVQRIVLCASQSLCVVVISAQWYWITRDTDANLPRVWSWTAAKLDVLQCSSIQWTLDKGDIDFLDNEDVPYWCERDTTEWHRAPARDARTMPHRPTSEMVHQWNYLGLHRVMQQA